MSVEYFAVQTNPWLRLQFGLRLFWPIALVAISACGPKKPPIPNDVEAIARSCYEAISTQERTPKLRPSEAMEDGKFLILWSIIEFPNEQGSCTVDGRGTVLLLTSNTTQQPAPDTTNTLKENDPP